MHVVMVGSKYMANMLCIVPCIRSNAVLPCGREMSQVCIGPRTVESVVDHKRRKGWFSPFNVQFTPTHVNAMRLESNSKWRSRQKTPMTNQNIGFAH